MVEVLHRAVIFMDIVIVRHVIAHVEERAFVNRRKPEDLHPEVF